MVTQRFFLAGEDEKHALELDICGTTDLDALKLQVAGEFHIVQPDGKAL